MLDQHYSNEKVISIALSLLEEATKAKFLEIDIVGFTSLCLGRPSIADTVLEIAT